MLRKCCLFHRIDSQAVNEWHAMDKSLDRSLLSERVEGWKKRSGWKANAIAVGSNPLMIYV